MESQYDLTSVDVVAPYRDVGFYQSAVQAITEGEGDALPNIKAIQRDLFSILCENEDSQIIH